MPKTYTVKIVNEQEWEELLESDPRYEKVDDDNVGFSDPSKRRAYVREQVVKNWPGVKQYLLEHEFEHLVSDEPWHQDEHGIRHKKGSDIFRNIAAVSLAPFTGGLSLSLGSEHFRNEAGDIIPREFTQEGPLGGFSTLAPNQPIGRAIRGATPALATAGAFLGGGALGLGPGKALFNPGVGRGAGALATQATPPAGATGNIVSRLVGGPTSLAGSGFNPAAGKSAFNLSGPLAGTSRLGTTLSAAGGGGGGGGGGFPFAGQIGSAVSQAATSGQTPASSGVLNTLSKFGIGKLAGPAALGAGIAGLGQAFGNRQRPEIPELGQLPGIQQFRTDVSNRLGPLQSRLQGLSNTPLPSALESPIRRQFQKQRQQLYSQFAAFRPGADLATDSEFRQAIEDLNQREAESVAQAQFGFQGNERQNIIAQLGVSEQELGLLQDLAQLDIDTIMARTGLAAEDANQIKQIFGNLGSAVAGAGILGAFGV